ncbi:MAG: hypothetical protein GY856_03130 [bacterium]|nr:hypothetical protein [bacterium]
MKQPHTHIPRSLKEPALREIAAAAETRVELAKLDLLRDSAEEAERLADQALAVDLDIGRAVAQKPGRWEVSSHRHASAEQIFLTGRESGRSTGTGAGQRISTPDRAEWR